MSSGHNASFEIRALGHEECGPLVPLLRAVQALHATAHPDLFRNDASDTDLAAFLREMTGRDGVTTLAAYAADQPLGFLTFAIETREASAIRCPGTEAVLHHISVASEARRRGVGRALVAEMRRRLRGAGVTRLSATHYAFNDTSAAFLRTIGLAPLKTVMAGPV